MKTFILSECLENKMPRTENSKTIFYILEKFKKPNEIKLLDSQMFNDNLSLIIVFLVGQSYCPSVVKI